MTAAREFYEETAGLVLSKDAMKNKLTNAPCIRSKTKRGLQYFMYLVEVPFNSELRINFQKVSSFLKYYHVHKTMMEKTDVAWVDFPTLMKMKLRE